MSNNPTERFRAELEVLEREGNKRETLENMKSFVFNVEKPVLRDIVRNVSIEPLFQHFNNLNDNEIDLLSAVVYELLSQLEAKELINNYGDFIQRILAHKCHEPKRIGLALFEKSISDDTIEYIMTKQISLVRDALVCVASEERSTAQGAISALIKLGASPIGMKTLFSDALMNNVKEIMAVNDTSRFRIYEIIAAIAKLSPECLSAAVSTGVLESLVKEVHSSDILVQLNALEVLSTLATSNHGLNYILECRVVDALAGKVLKLEEEPLSVMLLPGLIEFFGTVCIQQPEAFVKDYPQIINLLFGSLENNDQVLLGVIMSTVGKIGSTVSGRHVLIQRYEEMDNYLKKMMECLGTRNDLSLAVLNSLGELFKKLDGDELSNEVTEKWFNAMGTNALSNIVSITKLPFTEFRMAALLVLKVIANHEWGTRKLYNFPGMVEYLLDRSTEFNKDCQQMKYDVAFNMVHCPNVEAVMAQENLSNLKEFVKEGPFYIPVDFEVTTEGV